MIEKVLLVDDEPNVLAAMRRMLHPDFDLDLAGSGREALDLLENQGPYAAVISDMRMPGMDGLELLGRVREHWPDAARLMLTGDRDRRTAVDAINRGEIFRFLSKPCSASALAQALRQGIERFQLRRAQRELLEQTLQGSVEVLVHVLGLASPDAFGRSERLRAAAAGVADALELEDRWVVETAALLSQLGLVGVPADVLARHEAGEPLEESERALIAGRFDKAASLLESIPRLEDVVAAIRLLQTPARTPGSREAPPVAARVLKAVIDLDDRVSRGASPAHALATMRADARAYDPRVLDALEHTTANSAAPAPRAVHPARLRDGMVLAEDVRTCNNVLVLRRGQRVTPSVRTHLAAFEEAGQLPATLLVDAKD